MGLFRSLAKRALQKIVGGPDHANPQDTAKPQEAAKPQETAKPALPPPDPGAMEDDGARFATLAAGAQEVKERMDAGEPVLLVDVREPFETAAGIVPGAVLLPMGQLPARWRELENANEIVCYCASGVRSIQAARFLRERGLFNATSLEGGISEWMNLGGKIVRPG
jgi:rhodanese-related sulfurtransferase